MEILAGNFHCMLSLNISSVLSTFAETFLPSAKSLILIRLLETYQLLCWKTRISQQWRKIRSSQDWNQGGWNQGNRQKSTKSLWKANNKNACPRDLWSVTWVKDRWWRVTSALQHMTDTELVSRKQRMPNGPAWETRTREISHSSFRDWSSLLEVLMSLISVKRTHCLWKRCLHLYFIKNWENWSWHKQIH